jgi:hypothetical protein
MTFGKSKKSKKSNKKDPIVKPSIHNYVNSTFVDISP